MNPCHETSDQSSFLIWSHSSADRRARLIGLESQPKAAASIACLRASRCASAIFAPRSCSARLRSAGSCRFTSSMSSGSVASESAAMSTSASAMCWKSCRLLLMKRLERRDADRLRVARARRAGPRPTPPWTSRFRMTSAAPDPDAGQRMARGKVHPIAAAVDRRLQQLRELDEQRRCRSACAPRVRR